MKKNFLGSFKKISQTKLDKDLKFYDVVLTRFNHKINFLMINKRNMDRSRTMNERNEKSQKKSPFLTLQLALAA